jgi:hypothetical protein
MELAEDGLETEDNQDEEKEELPAEIIERIKMA